VSWICRGRPTAGPPRSPDWNPLNFYLCGHLETVVYAAPVDNEEAFHHRTVDACQTIRNCPGISERMRRSIMRRVEECAEPHGGKFEHLLQTTSFSYNSQIKCFRIRWYGYFFVFWYVELVPKVCSHLWVILFIWHVQLIQEDIQ
jgi:hypothetical protein